MIYFSPDVPLVKLKYLKCHLFIYLIGNKKKLKLTSFGPTFVFGICRHSIYIFVCIKLTKIFYLRDFIYRSVYTRFRFDSGFGLDRFHYMYICSFIRKFMIFNMFKFILEG